MFQSHRPGLINRYFWLQMTYAESDETWAPLTLRETPKPKYGIDASINCPHFMIMSQRKLCQVNFYHFSNIHPCIWLYTHESLHMNHRVAHQRTGQSSHSVKVKVDRPHNYILWYFIINVKGHTANSCSTKWYELDWNWIGPRTFNHDEIQPEYSRAWWNLVIWCNMVQQQSL